MKGRPLEIRGPSTKGPRCTGHVCGCRCASCLMEDLEQRGKCEPGPDFQRTSSSSWEIGDARLWETPGVYSTCMDLHGTVFLPPRTLESNTLEVAHRTRRTSILLLFPDMGMV